jgi:hypothetical protein
VIGTRKRRFFLSHLERGDAEAIVRTTGPSSMPYRSASGAQAKKLPNYLLGGGFFWGDDYHGSQEQAYFERTMVFPEHELVDHSAKVFHALIKAGLVMRMFCSAARTNLDTPYPQPMDLHQETAQDMVGTPRFLREENEKGTR